MSNQEQQFLNQYVGNDPLEQQQQMMYGEPEYYARPGEKLQPQRPRRKRGGPLFLVIVPLVVIVLLVACLAFAAGVLGSIPSFSHRMHDKGIRDWSSRNELQQTFLVTSISKLVIKGDFGAVNIRADENDTNKVAVNADQENIVANYNPETNIITIDANGLEGVNLNIETPKTTDIQVNEISGGVNIEGVTGQMDIEDNSGSIDVVLPETASFHLDASTKKGRFNNDFGNDDVGSSPHPTLKLRSGSGSIEVHKG